MIKNVTIIELKGREDKVYRFVCENDSPLGEIHDILCQMRGEILQRIESIQFAKQSTDLNECEVCEDID